MKAKMNKLFFIFLAVGALVANACSDPFESDITPAYEDFPVVGVLENSPETFSAWVELIQHAGLKQTLNLDANYTCFVPDNEAVAAFLADREVSSVTALSVEEARNLVKFHTIAGAEYSQSLFANGVLPDTTATGDYLSIDLRPGGLDSVFINNEARILQMDISAINGIIHSIDRVLTPVVETIWDKLNSNSQFSVFREAVALTGFDVLLDEVSYMEYNKVTGAMIQKRWFLTTFLVDDGVFAEEGIPDVDALIAQLNAGTEGYAREDNPLYLFVAYHILDQQLDFSMLSSFPEDSESKNIATLAPNELINLSQRGDSLVFNYAPGEVHRVIVEPNINARNGIVHELSRVMEVQAPPAARIVWEPTDYADLSALFPSHYRRSGLTSTYREYIEQGSVQSYEWEAIPSDRVNLAVSYYVANRNDAVPYGMMNHDALVFQGGLYGWIEMETPAIVRGTYDLKVRYYSINSATRYGKFLTILDGSYLGSEIATHGSSSTTARLQTTTIGRVTFEETAPHVLRILASDNFAVYLDYFEFVPVE
jgi:uncharacterized surface protein with fasciclin (FAS1) repeats